MSQDLTFTQTVNKLFFDFDVSNNSSSLFDSLLSVPQLHHFDKGARQWNLNVSMEMNSHKAWSTKHEFSFTQSPLTGLNIEKGIIDVTLGETEDAKKLLNIYWRIQFSNKEEATMYFEKLKQIFGDLSTKKKFDFGKDVGHIAEFSTGKQTDKGIKDITLFLYQSLNSKKYEVALLFGNELMDE